MRNDNREEFPTGLTAETLFEIMKKYRRISIEQIVSLNSSKLLLDSPTKLNRNENLEHFTFLRTILCRFSVFIFSQRENVLLNCVQSTHTHVRAHEDACATSVKPLTCCAKKALPTFARSEVFDFVYTFAAAAALWGRPCCSAV